MLRDLGHPYARGEKQYDVTFENVQAGERTSHLFRLANHHGGLVIGTGDLSELALGWCTYGVGDQMSHYAVNASVPKTLISFMLRWVIDTGQFDDEVNAVLQSVLDTEISPELVPGDGRQARRQTPRARSAPTSCRTSTSTTSCASATGRARSRSWPSTPGATRERGPWPDLIPPDAPQRLLARGRSSTGSRSSSTASSALSQFKRSAIPNGPKVGSGGSLSPRGDWRAPSDANATVWLDELRANVPD